MFSKCSWRVLFSVLCVQTLLAQTVCAQPTTGAIFPLYIYPETCTSWSTILDSISSNPTLPFYLIINPNSGPVAVPDEGFRTCIPQARSLGSNVKIVGYVKTGYGNKTSSAVLSEIETYFAWDASYRPTGIFFDEVDASEGHLALYTSYASQVRTDVPDDSVVILNPGIPVTVDDYFSFADLIVTTENFFDEFDPSDLQISDTQPASEQAVILHTGPQTLPTALIDELAGDGLGALFITNMIQDFAYNTTPSYWEEFVDELASSQA